MSKKIFQYHDHDIIFEFSDGNKMINATQMAKPFGKRVSNFLQNKETKEYISLLESRYWNSSIGSKRAVLRIVKGGNEKDAQGTWMDEKLALKFAAWLAPVFELWVYDRIEELLKTGTTSITFHRDKNIFKTLRLLVDEMENQSIEIDKVKNRLDYIEEIILDIDAKITSHDENYYTVAGFCAYHGLPCELKQAQKWGRAATILSNKKGFDIGAAHSEVYGNVGTYHKEILEQVIKV